MKRMVTQIHTRPQGVMSTRFRCAEIIVERLVFKSVCEGGRNSNVLKEQMTPHCHSVRHADLKGEI